MNNKKTSCFLIGLIFTACVFGQNNLSDYEKKMNEAYGKYEKQANDNYNCYRDKANAAFAEYMRKGWKEFKGSLPQALPPSPDPAKQPKAEPNTKPKNEPVPYKEVMPIPVPLQPIPIEPIPIEPKSEDEQFMKFNFYNTQLKIRLCDSLKFSLPGVTEEFISTTWKKLSGASYNAALSDCLSIREEYKLCDWAYMKMLKQMAISFLGTDKENEATLFQIFILNQSGYRVRMARTTSNQIKLLIASDYQIYQYPFYTLDADKFYLIDSKDSQLYIFNQAFPNERQLSLAIVRELQFSANSTSPKQFFSERYPEVRVKTPTNKELINFFNAYPNCDWKVYANTPLSENIRQNIYPVLKQNIRGKSEAASANILINFIQTAFNYQTDDQQFGYERPLFPDELFYYPYSDCEDRSILFSRLVRDLLNLEVVLLHYPNHLATAVKFNENIEGDYLTVNNAKYIVCDPTYIGANIGMAMPQFKQVKADVYTLRND